MAPPVVSMHWPVIQRALSEATKGHDVGDVRRPPHPPEDGEGGHLAFPTAAAYAMAKGALNALTLTLAQDLGARGITVNAVVPGPV
jgi:NAD(P)-dependent dehydrogenase (short-subunit alcohol dehydrogenase family)